MTIAAGSGLVINVTYGLSVSGAPVGFQTAVAAAVNFFETSFTNQITVNIQVGYGEVGGVAMNPGSIGESTSSGVHVSYAQLAAVLPGLPASNPTGSGVFYVADAEAKALGLATDGAAFDGAVGISSAYAIGFDPNHRATPGVYDGVGAIEHEISEVLGRISELGSATFRRQAVYSALDLFRYAAPGVRSFSTTAIAYFSADGVNLQTQFNAPSNGGDGGDWIGSIRGDAFGDSYLGAADLITATDLAVMQAIGYATAPALGGTQTVSGPSASVLAAVGATVNIGFDNAGLAAVAQGLLSPLSPSVIGGQVIVAMADAGIPVAAGKTGLAEVTAGGQYAIGAGYSGLVDAATVPVTVFGGSSAGQLVVAGIGGLAFNAGSGAGTVIAGGGNNLISVYPGAGAQNIQTGGGNDVIVALAGNNTISGGLGRNQILAQGGNNIILSAGTDLINAPDGNVSISAGTNAPTIFFGSGAASFNGGNGQATVVVGSAAATLTSTGRDQLWLKAGGGVVNSSNADTVIGGSGAATVNAGASNDFVFSGSGALNFVGGSGAATILGASAGSATIFGGGHGLVDIAYGATLYIGGSAADTVACFGGAVTATGGSGNSILLGGPGGGNRLTGGSGQQTLIGGGDGDLLTASSIAANVLQAGLGAETLTGAGSSALQKFYAGSGQDLLIAGRGGSQMLAGSGRATMVGGAGADLFAFGIGNAGTIVIQNFTAGTDFVSLLGFTNAESGRALSSATIISGSEQLVLSDGTRILFQNVIGLSSANFL